MKKNRSNSVECLKKTFAWKKHLLSLIFLATFFPSAAYSAIYYVDNSGSPACSNVPANGTEAHPWCTITYGIGRLSSKDTLYVKSGTYNEEVYINRPAGDSWGNTIIRAYPGHTVTIRGAGNTGRVKITGTRYLTLDGFIITNFQQGLFIEGTSDHITVQNCTIHDTYQEGLHVKQNCSYITLQNNTIYNTGLNTSANGEGVYIGTSSSNQAVPYDLTHHVTVKNCTIYNVKDEAIELKPGTHECILDGNTVYNYLLDSGITAVNWGAIEVMNPKKFYLSNPNHVVMNNTIYGIKTAIGIHTGATVFNNVIYGQTGSYRGISIDNDDGDSYTRYIYHNTVDLPNARAIIRSSGTWDSKNNIGPSTTNNMATSDSYYVNKAGRNYHLVAGSAPINAGLNLTATVPTDIEGNSRSANPPPDLGAYEYIDTDTTAPIPPRNLRVIQ